MPWTSHRRVVPTPMIRVDRFEDLDEAARSGGIEDGYVKGNGEGDGATIVTASGISDTKFPFYLAKDPMGMPYPISPEAFQKTFDPEPVKATPTAGHIVEPIAALCKQAVTCQGRKIRMEFYLGHEPLRCPVCSELLRSKCAACGQEFPTTSLQPAPQHEGFEGPRENPGHLGCRNCLTAFAHRCCWHGFHSEGHDHGDDCKNRTPVKA